MPTSSYAEPDDPTMPSVTVVIPTYHEVASIPHLLTRLAALREQAPLDLDLLLMDDDSRDGSAELVESMGLSWAKLVTRTQDRGLSPAVIDGLKMARGEFVVVMDADLSHPPEAIPALLGKLAAGAELAVGSRFVEGGTTADDWGPFRWLNSRIATLLAFPLTRISDPMSGFFAMRRRTFQAADNLNPVGYKILLELIVKTRSTVVAEVPIHFDNRRFGESKLSLSEQLRYLRHLRRLYTFRYGTWSHLAQFLLVGVSGLAVNLLLLTIFLHLAIPGNLAIALAIVGSMLWNFVLNRRYSFSYARDQSFSQQLLKFVAACSVGAVVNYFVTLALLPILHRPQTAAVLGVLAGTAFNFGASRFLVFRAKHVKS